MYTLNISQMHIFGFFCIFYLTIALCPKGEGHCHFTRWHFIFLICSCRLTTWETEREENGSPEAVHKSLVEQQPLAPSAKTAAVFNMCWGEVLGPEFSIQLVLDTLWASSDGCVLLCVYAYSGIYIENFCLKIKVQGCSWWVMLQLTF